MVRGGIRGRGGIGGGRGGSMRGGAPFKKTFVPRHPFDLTLAEIAFPKVSPVIDDSALTAVSS